MLHEFGALFGVPDPRGFAAACAASLEPGRAEILGRAVTFVLKADACPLEISFISLYAALESVLTYSRRRGDFDILPDRDFQALEHDLKAWLRRHPLLAEDAARRSLVYEKARELNRFPFSRIFAVFCERHVLDLSDLWPLVGRAREWPLMEIRHRLVHGDAFTRRPSEAIMCAREHLRWTVARMIFAALGGPVSLSYLSPESLARAGEVYTGWREERAKLA
jgi:hypothetical protein